VDRKHLYIGIFELYIHENGILELFETEFGYLLFHYNVFNIWTRDIVKHLL